jgi:hypothetical protein
MAITQQTKPPKLNSSPIQSILFTRPMTEVPYDEVVVSLSEKFDRMSHTPLLNRSLV